MNRNVVKTAVTCCCPVLLCAFIACGTRGKDAIIVPGKNGKALYGSAAMDGTRAYVSYYDTGAKELRIARSLDGGLTWKASDARTVAPLLTAIRYAPVAAAGDAVFVLFRDARAETLRCARSMDGGDTWKNEDICAVDGCINGGEHCALAVNGKEVCAAYNEVKTGILRFAVSRDLGASWPQDDARTVDATADSKGGQFISIAAIGRNVYITYNGAYHGKGKGKSLRFARSSDGGRTWNAADIRTIDGPQCSLGVYGALAADGVKLYASYASKKGLMFATSPDGGATWERDSIRLVDKSETKKMVSNTVIAARGGEVRVDYTKGDGLWCAFSRDGGATWRKEEIRRLAGIGDSILYQKVSMAGTGGSLIITYYDAADSSMKALVSRNFGATWHSAQAGK